jgi:hypothetical protein
MQMTMHVLRTKVHDLATLVGLRIIVYVLPTLVESGAA